MDNKVQSSSSDQIACPACNTLAPLSQRFCGQCGASLRQICTTCSAESPLNDRFCGQCGAVLAHSPQPTVTQPREERRWVTVLFVDVSGFTAMSEQMDPEDVKILADGWTRRLSQEIRQFGGTVINVVGDEVVAVFGAPTAHEDDPERAVRAGLAMASLNLSDDPDRPIQVHVGLNTGEVMAGLMGPRERRDYNIMGDTVNTAARLLSAASAGMVFVGQETFRATRQAVSYAERPPITAKGKDQPVPVWEALDVAAVPQARSLGSSPLIGRDEELARLTTIWERVTGDAQPCLVTLLGEAGIGKSRLIAEFKQYLPADTTVLYGRCLSYGEALSYGAMGAMLKEVADIKAEDEIEVARTKLGSLVEQAMGPDGVDDAPQIAQHLALLGGLDTQADRDIGVGDQHVLLASTRHFLQALAGQNPLCLIFDDIHWADEALLDLIEHIASRLQEAPLLMITQSRPELLEKRTAWGQRAPSFTLLRLKPLDKQAERALIENICRKHGLTDEIATQIRSDAGGNPLYVEELVTIVAEQGETSGIPSAIKLLISARLDVLPAEERHTLQLASIFGTTFWKGGLRALMTNDVTPLLETLTQKGLLQIQTQSQYPDQQEYAFKHDLIREVAYKILPRAKRCVLHGQAVDWFEQTSGEHIDAFYDLIAHHAVEAGQHERAIAYLMKAAERAGWAVAHRREAALLGQALTIAKNLGQPSLITDLHARRGKAFIHVSMWADARLELEAALTQLLPEHIEQRALVLLDLTTVGVWLFDGPGVRRYAAEAIELAKLINRDDIEAGALFTLAASHTSDGDLQAHDSLAEQSLILAGNKPTTEIVAGMGIWGITLHWLGRFDEAIERSRHSARLARDMNHIPNTLVALPQVGLALTAKGNYAEAEQIFAEAQQFGREYEIWPLLARSIAMSTGYHLDVFDYTGHKTLAEEARELAKSVNFPPTVISASIDLLFNFIRRQEIGPAKKLLDDLAGKAERAVGFHGWLWRLRLAEAQAEIALVRGDWEAALQGADNTIAQSSAVGRVKYHALGLHSRASALHALGRDHEAIANLKEAVDMTRATSDPAIFLRIATSLLAIEGNDALLAETQASAQCIITNLPNEEMRHRFEAAESVQLLPHSRNASDGLNQISTL